MDQSERTSMFTSNYSKTDTGDKASQKTATKEISRIARGDCTISASTSHTQYFRRILRTKDEFKRITTNEFCGLTADSLSGSSETFQCQHGPEGKQYTERGLLKRNLLKNLDPIPRQTELMKDCPPALGWDIAEKIVFLIKDPAGVQQIDRIQEYLRHFAKTASSGYLIDTLNNLCVILDYLIDSINCKIPYYRDGFIELMKNIEKPILLKANSDIVTHFENIKNFIGFLGYMLLPLEDDDLFALVSNGLFYQLSAPDKQRVPQGVRQMHMLAAARGVLTQTVVRMIATARPNRFPTFIQIAFLLACDFEDNCYEFIMENIFENIFYRFNPYFPDRSLQVYDINPYDIDDYRLQLGDSSTNLPTVLSLLLVLLKTAQQFIERDPSYRETFPCPDEYSQRCFVWAYRFECRAQHRHQRSTLTVIAHLFILIFGPRLTVFSNVLMLDVLTLSVSTEVLPPKNDWTSTVRFNTSQDDVQFKKLLIYLSIDFLKLYPRNRFMSESRYWIVGLMYLVDPGLTSLRTKWTSMLYAELRQAALQALMCSMDYIPPDLPTHISLIRRIMWYIEWYSESPYALSILYWSVRLLYASIMDRYSANRQPAIQELLQTHGVVIISNLCHTLMDQKLPPMDRTQTIMGMSLRLLTSCLECKTKVSCYVYPSLRWPSSISQLVKKTLNIALYCLENRTVFSDRWLLSLMNLIWEAIIWKKSNREMFVANNGVYQLLDIIVMTRYPVQCLSLALICDIMRGGGAVGQLVTWRASIHASNTVPLVLPGATIASLLAAISRRHCLYEKINLDESNVLQDTDFPLMTPAVREYLFSTEFIESRNQRTPFCLSASEIAGSRMAKCYAILQMLSEDLRDKVNLADESYNLYKNIQLKENEEAMLVLVSHYLTIKLNQTWLETQIQSHGYVPIDTEIVEEFLHIGRGWAKSIQQQQLEVLEKFKKVEENNESTLYSFFERVQLNTALDSLREVKCIARSTDRARITHALIFDAVRAYHRRSVFANKLNAPVVQTYRPPLDDCNNIGQTIKVINILPKYQPKKRDDLRSEASIEPQELLATQSSQSFRNSPGLRDSKDYSVSHGSLRPKGSRASQGSRSSKGSQGKPESQGSKDSQVFQGSQTSKGSHA